MLATALSLAFALGAPAAGGRQPAIPGALPAGFRYHYADGFHGWPVAPLHREHPVRGAFLAPRGGGYHFGIDISVDDFHADPGAPRSRSHRVYAIESGVVRGVHDRAGSACVNRRLSVAHFEYWHVDPTVRQWSHVRAGTPIGWSCKGEWHVHLSEWASYAGERVWVNPLHRRGKLLPYVKTTRPAVGALRFADTRGRRLNPDALAGRVELLATVSDKQSFLGWLRHHRRLVVPDPPYRLAVTIRSRDGHVVLRRVAFQADQLPQVPLSVFYAPGTTRDLSVAECLESGTVKCGHADVFRPFSRYRREFWDTRSFANGRYDLKVTAWDVRGNVGSRSVQVVVRNELATGGPWMR